MAIFDMGFFSRINNVIIKDNQENELKGLGEGTVLINYVSISFFSALLLPTTFLTFSMSLRPS